MYGLEGNIYLILIDCLSIDYGNTTFWMNQIQVLNDRRHYSCKAIFILTNSELLSVEEVQKIKIHLKKLYAKQRFAFACNEIFTVNKQNTRGMEKLVILLQSISQQHDFLIPKSWMEVFEAIREIKIDNKLWILYDQIQGMIKERLDNKDIKCSNSEKVFAFEFLLSKGEILYSFSGTKLKEHNSQNQQTIFLKVNDFIRIILDVAKKWEIEKVSSVNFPILEVEEIIDAIQVQYIPVKPSMVKILKDIKFCEIQGNLLLVPYFNEQKTQLTEAIRIDWKQNTLSSKFRRFHRGYKGNFPIGFFENLALDLLSTGYFTLIDFWKNHILLAMEGDFVLIEFEYRREFEILQIHFQIQYKLQDVFSNLTLYDFIILQIENLFKYHKIPLNKLLSFIPMEFTENEKKLEYLICYDYFKIIKSKHWITIGSFTVLLSYLDGLFYIPIPTIDPLDLKIFDCFAIDSFRYFSRCILTSPEKKKLLAIVHQFPDLQLDYIEPYLIKFSPILYIFHFFSFMILFVFFYPSSSLF